jgi:hypothetical protein
MGWIKDATPVIQSHYTRGVLTTQTYMCSAGSQSMISYHSVLELRSNWLQMKCPNFLISYFAALVTKQAHFGMSAGCSVNGIWTTYVLVAFDVNTHARTHTHTHRIPPRRPSHPYSCFRWRTCSPSAMLLCHCTGHRPSKWEGCPSVRDALPCAETLGCNRCKRW